VLLLVLPYHTDIHMYTMLVAKEKFVESLLEKREIAPNLIRFKLTNAICYIEF
jgi:hypothetical protein